MAKWRIDYKGFAFIEADTAEEAKYLQDIHGKKVCVAVPYNENMVEKGIMQLEKRIKFHEKEIARSEEYIKNDKAKIEVLNSEISKLKERIIKQS